MRCFLASEALIHMPTPEIASRGDVTMTSLGRNGGFGNQLFQYAYVKLYALRHGLTAKFPYWQGRELYRLADPLCGGAALQQLSFNGFTDNDLQVVGRGQSSDQYRLVGLLPGDARVLAPTQATVKANVFAGGLANRPGRLA